MEEKYPWSAHYDDMAQDMKMERAFTVCADDIPYQLAYDAHRGTSMVPDTRAEQVRDEYVSMWKRWIDEFAGYGDEDAMWEELKVFNTQYLERFSKVLSVKGNCISSMITGPSGFNVHRAMKANDREMQVTQDFVKWYTKRLKRLRSKWNPDLIDSAPVRTGDSDAVERLTGQLEKLSIRQDHMKAANKILRRKITDAEKIQQLAEIGVHISKTQPLDNLIFPSYMLTNGASNIRRLRQRLEQVRKEADRRQQPVEDVVADGVRMHENYEIDRLQLVFDHKPNANIRRWLGAHGFHWSRRENAWQRQLTDNARAAGKAFMDSLGGKHA